LAVPNTLVFRSAFDGRPDLKTEPSKGPSWLNPNFVRCMTVSWPKRIDAEEKTKGGIIIPDSARKASQGEISGGRSGRR